ncbi:hypothetical protein [Kineobactrum salinum]|uniref:Uncharacterized protein n=1 Tax=Kineobactrum salinum TaxID=2708301 RepID=A0A6C0TWR1_9GAMM|nr:hypothetical protein [Kineobactrum salinum]QIB64221.1 hypothetical protein G3T16_01130 [Kineobactrum salinum]
MKLVAFNFSIAPTAHLVVLIKSVPAKINALASPTAIHLSLHQAKLETPVFISLERNVSGYLHIHIVLIPSGHPDYSPVVRE